ncbi:DUF2752 domain-containing protein [Streptomyces spiramenti]|uniref:DUF2752 domain-containing protein n=1 Tax=Streptomyces spiramenti TaxID=2720606 RepID=UPI003B831C9C
MTPGRPSHPDGRAPVAPGRSSSHSEGVPLALLRRTAAPLGVLALAVAAFAYVGQVDPHEPGHYPACPVLALTGVHCPGCGGLRSAHAVAHGDLAAAVGANALAFAAFVVGAWWGLRLLSAAARGTPSPLPTVRSGHLWAVGAVVVLFTVVRNTPLGAVLVP